jgi:transposase
VPPFRYDANSFQTQFFLGPELDQAVARYALGAVPIIPGRRTRRRSIRHDVARYKERWRIEAAFCRLKDFRRVAPRYDKPAVNFASAVTLAVIVAFWT